MQVRPHLDITFENILSHINTVYVLKTKKGVMQVEASEEFSNLRLKVTTTSIYLGGQGSDTKRRAYFCDFFLEYLL